MCHLSETVARNDAEVKTHSIRNIARNNSGDDTPTATTVCSILRFVAPPVKVFAVISHAFLSAHDK